MNSELGSLHCFPNFTQGGRAVGEGNGPTTLCRDNEPLTNAISLRQQERGGVLLGDWRQIFVAEGVGLKGGWVLARGKEVWGFHRIDCFGGIMLPIQTWLAV